MTDLEKVQQIGFALEYVKDQTPELCLIAVKQDEYALQFVKSEHLNFANKFKNTNLTIQEIKEQYPEYFL